MMLSSLTMRIFEAIFLVMGVILAVLLSLLSQAFIKAGTTDIALYQTLGSGLKQGEYWFLTPMQLIPLGVGGVILTSMLY